MVWVRGLRVKAHEERVLGTGGLTLGDHVVVVSCSLGHEIRVADEGDVFDRVGNGVGLAVVGPGVDGDILEVARLVAELDRCHDTVGHEGSQPVVRAHRDVGAFTGRNLLDELVADLAELLLDERDLDAGLLGEVGSRRLEHACTVGVDPHGDGAGHVRRRGLATV